METSADVSVVLRAGRRVLYAGRAEVASSHNRLRLEVDRRTAINFETYRRVRQAISLDFEDGVTRRGVVDDVIVALPNGPHRVRLRLESAPTPPPPTVR